MTSSSSSTRQSTQPLPIVQVFLSRPTYRLGSSVVGTIRVSWPEQEEIASSSVAGSPSIHAQHDNTRTLPSLRDSLVSLQLYAAGRCRIDPRWHQVANYVKLYGPNHPHLNANIEQRVIQQSLQWGMPTSSSSSMTTTSSSSIPLKRSSSIETSVADMEAAAIASSVVCFWATNVVELLDLPERDVGAWEEVKPKPIKLHGVKQTPLPPPSSFSQQNIDETHDNKSWNAATTGAASFHSPGHLERHSDVSHTIHGSKDAANVVAAETTTILNTYDPAAHKKEHLMFTFRIDLPIDIPPTFTASSCRYFYSLVVRGKAKIPTTKTTMSSAAVSTVDILVHVPLTILLTSSSIAMSLSSSSSPSGLASSAVEDPTRRRSHKERVKVGSCVAMAHSSGLPCHVSATDMQHRNAGPITVRRRPHSSSDAPSAAANNIPTLRVADPYGNPCCILTVIGDTMKWIPGSRVILQLDFPHPRRRRRKNDRYDDDNVEENDNNSELVWIPCYQASACLTGEEMAVYEDGSRKRTRLYSLDTSHETIDPQTTQRVCLSLFLPLDCPCTVETDLVEIAVQCRVDITVGNVASVQSGSNPVYTNLRLDLPCRVVQGDDGNDDEDEQGYSMQDDDRHVNNLPLNELLFGHIDHDEVDDTTLDTHLFEKKDILKDLKVLSLQALDFYE